MARTIGTQIQSTDVAKNPGAAVTVLNASSTPVLVANPSRALAIISNDGANVVYLSFGGTAALNSGMRLAAGATLTISAFTGAINGRAATGDTVVTVVDI